MKFLRAIYHSGLQFAQTPSERRGILLCNQICLILFGVGILMFVSYYYWYGWSFVTLAIPAVAVLSLIPIALNSMGFSMASRLWLCISVPAIITAVSIYSKTIYYNTQEELDYFTFRFVILACCVFPFILFSLKEYVLLILSSLAGLTVLMLHDPLHNHFHVGYHQNDLNPLKSTNYYYTNVVILFTYCVMVGAVVFLKWVSEKNENKNTELIRELNQAYDVLVEKNAEIEAQSMELMAQSEILNANQQKLLDTYQEIEKHKNFLSDQNQSLTSELLVKNKDLTYTNTELIKHNNELRQFSYTVSHNLRGPVASLLGLNRLIDVEQLDDNNRTVIHHFKDAVAQLDGIIHDLGKIIDIRHDIFKIRQKIHLEDEVKEIKRVLKKEIETHQIKIRCDFSSYPDVYSVKPMVHSILYNLISNSIKYRSLDRPVEIELTAYEDSQYFILSVRDNGLGIDLNRNKENLFKLYKRFHYHTEGKGLGLYLVKLQCEALGGYIEVDSELNKYTNFIVHLRKPENIQMQLLYNEPHARIFYDAKINSTGVKWHGPVTSEEYRRVFEKCLEFLKAYNTPSWISDISDQGPIAAEDQQWMFEKILAEAVKNGLKRIAAIRPEAQNVPGNEYLAGIQEAISKLGIDQAAFNDFEEAFSWIMEENEKAAVKNDLDDGRTDLA